MKRKNDKGKLFYVLLLVVSTSLGGVGQLLFKAGLLQQSAYIAAIAIAIGILVYVISTAVYFYTLARVQLSWAYGFGGLSYIVAEVLAYLVLAEPVGWARWTGVVVIAIGTMLVGWS